MAITLKLLNTQEFCMVCTNHPPAMAETPYRNCDREVAVIRAFNAETSVSAIAITIFGRLLQNPQISHNGGNSCFNAVFKDWKPQAFSAQ
jgi:hypothetical protein